MSGHLKTLVARWQETFHFREFIDHVTGHKFIKIIGALCFKAKLTNTTASNLELDFDQFSITALVDIL